MIVRFHTSSVDDLKNQAEKIASTLPKGVIVFKGAMGAGKTTTIAALCKAWGVEDVVQSPTFALVNEYADSEGSPVYHFDFYRIDSEEEAMDMGCEDYFWSGERCLVEWAEKIPNLLPPKFTTVHIETVDGLRNLTLDVPE